jgi:5-methylcytosine-specific restriction endonuclease McrA
MSNLVFVLDTQKRPLSPIRPGLARKLLSNGKAAVFKRYPFTLILKVEVIAPQKPIILKLDPGSKTTGIALVRGEDVIFGAELTHRGQAIKASLESRCSLRRVRRNRHTRYRKAKFSNRTRPKGWLAPSLQHRVETTLTWVTRLTKVAPIASITQELVRFDLQQLGNPEISGIEYQQGVLHGCESREYLLNKWERTCAYCGVTNTPLQVEHIHPKAKGGSNRISNLCLACDACNKKKGIQDVEQFLSKKPEILKRILSQAKRPLKDAAAVNSTRWALFNGLRTTGWPVSTGSGGLTKFNRTRLNLAKTHWLDAACVGKVESLKILTNKPLSIEATGHGTRQMCRTDKFGFPSRFPGLSLLKGFKRKILSKQLLPLAKKLVHTLDVLP